MIAGMILAPFFAKKMKNRNIAIMFFGFGIIGLLGLYVGAKIMSISADLRIHGGFGIVPDWSKHGLRDVGRCG